MKIFAFHRVHPERDRLWPPVHPQQFEELVKYIARKFRVVRLEDWLTDELDGRSPASHIASIVFDDGYRDFLDYALPILSRHRLPSSMYVVTSCVDTGLPTWTYQLDHVFTTTRHTAFDLDGFEAGPRHLAWRNEDERFALAAQLKLDLKAARHDERIRVMDALRGAADDVIWPEGLMMSWDDVREAAAAGVAVGSHSVSHPLLDKLEFEDLRKELRTSYAAIERELRSAPLVMSYPNGNVSSQVEVETQRAGYSFGLAGMQTTYRPGRHSRFAIPRIELNGEPLWKSKLRIYEIIQSAKGWRDAVRRLRHRAARPCNLR